MFNKEASLPDYLLNLGVVTKPESEKVEESYSVAREKRNHIRYKTFIPEYTEVIFFFR